MSSAFKTCKFYLYFIGNDRLSGKQDGSQASRRVTRRLAWTQQIPTCLHKHKCGSRTERVSHIKPSSLNHIYLAGSGLIVHLIICSSDYSYSHFPQHGRPAQSRTVEGRAPSHHPCNKIIKDDCLSQNLWCTKRVKTLFSAQTRNFVLKHKMSVLKHKLCAL